MDPTVRAPQSAPGNGTIGWPPIFDLMCWQRRATRAAKDALASVSNYFLYAALPAISALHRVSYWRALLTITPIQPLLIIAFAGAFIEVAAPLHITRYRPRVAQILGIEALSEFG